LSTAARSAAFATLALLTACGKPLGTYEVGDVKLVPGSALEKIEPYRKLGPDLLRIEFTSATDLYEASKGGGGLYLWGSFCPYDADRRLRTFGPYYNDRNLYPSAVDDNGKVVEIPDVRPIRDPRTGKYIYTGYLDLASPSDYAWDPPYDLRRQAADICLRIDNPGYFITPSRSRVFKIPAAMIRASLLKRQAAQLQRRP